MAALQETLREVAEDVMDRLPAQKRPAPVARKDAEGVRTGSVEFPSLAVYDGHLSGLQCPCPKLRTDFRQERAFTHPYWRRWRGDSVSRGTGSEARSLE